MGIQGWKAHCILFGAVSPTLHFRRTSLFGVKLILQQKMALADVGVAEKATTRRAKDGQA